LLFLTVPPAATCWSGWPVVAIASWSWARATIRFRSSHVSSFGGLQRQKTKVRLPLVIRPLPRFRPREGGLAASSDRRHDRLGSASALGRCPFNVRIAALSGLRTGSIQVQRCHKRETPSRRRGGVLRHPSIERRLRLRLTRPTVAQRCRMCPLPLSRSRRIQSDFGRLSYDAGAGKSGQFGASDGAETTLQRAASCPMTSNSARSAATPGLVRQS
jgi:hypothetical protein